MPHYKTIGWAVLLASTIGIVTDAAAVPENNSSLSLLARSTEKFDRVIGICHLAQNPAVPTTTAVNVIEPLMSVEDYLTKWEHKTTKGVTSTRVLEQPEHGLLEEGGDGAYVYTPNEIGYLGKDQATILVEMSGLKIKVKYFFNVLNSLPTDQDQENFCPTFGMWRISQMFDLNNGADLGHSPSPSLIYQAAR